jgi:rRNA biogenesis protein RRP5
MPSQKRLLDSGTSSHKAKRAKLSNNGKTRNEPPLESLSGLASADIDFPRGGGTSFTPLEVKTIRAEAVREANEELFGVIIVLMGALNRS